MRSPIQVLGQWASPVAAVTREAMAEVRSQKVFSVLTAAMISGMCAATLLTAGRTAAAEAAALARIDDAGTRTITVRASAEAGLEATVVDRIARIDGVEAVTAFGPIVDARNALVPDAPLVPLRPAYGSLAASLGVGTAHASTIGAEQLGLVDGSGSVVTSDGHEVLVVGGLNVPAYIQEAEPLVVMPSSPSPTSPVAQLVILVREPQLVETVSNVAVGLLGLDDKTKATIETSAELAAVRSAVGGELEQYGRSTVLGIFGVVGGLLALSVFGLIQLRRKHLGRRRALGASRGLIVQLLLVQVAALGTAGAGIGTGATLLALASAHAPIPSAAFCVAVAAAGVLTSTIATAAPAVVASRRDPLYELRVP